MIKIFINPGHSKDGKPDPGCVYNGIKECDICASIAKLLKEKLEYNGFLVDYYQQTGYNNNANSQLNSVAKLANQCNSDAFISIHMNGFNKDSAKGTETLYHSGSSKGQVFAECINNELTKPFDSYQLTNRGVKADTRGLAVLRDTKMTAILTEIGFISNKEEANFIKNNINVIAQRLCNGICLYFNKIPKEQKSNNTKFPKNINLTLIEDDKYDVMIDDKLVLKKNKFFTVIEWLKSTYDT